MYGNSPYIAAYSIGGESLTFTDRYRNDLSRKPGFRVPGHVAVGTLYWVGR